MREFCISRFLSAGALAATLFFTGQLAHATEALPKIEDAITGSNIEALTAHLEDGLEVDQILERMGLRGPMLALAMKAQKVNVAAFLIDQGATVDMVPVSSKTHGDRREPQPYSPLMIAARYDFAEGARLLLRSKADPNVVDEHNVTALMVAAATNGLLVARELVAAGADLNARADRIDSILQVEGLGVEPIVIQMKRKDNSGLYALRPSEKLEPGEGATALWLAVIKNDDHLVYLLFKAGADPEIEANCAGVQQYGEEARTCTALQLAERLNNDKVLKALGKTVAARSRPKLSEVFRGNKLIRVGRLPAQAVQSAPPQQASPRPEPSEPPARVAAPQSPRPPAAAFPVNQLLPEKGCDELLDASFPQGKIDEAQAAFDEKWRDTQLNPNIQEKKELGDKDWRENDSKYSRVGDNLWVKRGEGISTVRETNLRPVDRQDRREHVIEARELATLIAKLRAESAAALHDIGSRPCPEAFERLEEACGMVAKDCTRSVITALALLKPEESLGVLTLVVRRGDAIQRESAIRAVGNIPGKDSLELLVEVALGEKDDKVRTGAYDFLGKRLYRETHETTLALLNERHGCAVAGGLTILAGQYRWGHETDPVDQEVIERLEKIAGETEKEYACGQQWKTSPERDAKALLSLLRDISDRRSAAQPPPLNDSR